MDVAPVAGIPDIDRCIQTGLQDKTFSGAACIASVGDRIFHRAAYGHAALPPPPRKIGIDALFDLGSLTRPLATGLAALWLVSKGRLDLRVSLAKIIPELQNERFAAVTLDMLLDHTSGLPAAYDLWRAARDAAGRQPEAERGFGTSSVAPIFRRLLGGLALAERPGTAVVESDLGFLVLGWIVESVVEQPLDVFLERAIYRPLGLADELFFVRLDDPRRRLQLGRRTFVATAHCPHRKRLLQGEVEDANAWGLGGVAGHAGLFGTVDAVWKLVLTLWESYTGRGRFFLGGTVRRFWTRSQRVRTTRTLGWNTPAVNDSVAGKRFSSAAVGEVASNGGAVWVDLSTGVIGVFLANASHPATAGKEAKLGALGRRLFEIIAKHGEALAATSRAR